MLTVNAQKFIDMYFKNIETFCTETLIFLDYQYFNTKFKFMSLIICLL